MNGKNASTGRTGQGILGPVKIEDIRRTDMYRDYLYRLRSTVSKPGEDKKIKKGTGYFLLSLTFLP